MSLEADYIVPPFSVLDTTDTRWRRRRAWWLGMGIQSELGRSGNAPGGGEKGGRGAWLRRAGSGYAPTDAKYGDGEESSEGTGTSIFDPVLCELVYRWWCPPGGTILDPFAGGSVRGIVAASLGHPYVGVDLREDQVEANREQAGAILPPDVPTPRWVVGDSRHALAAMSISPDLIFTCPPYFDLERYSDDPRDLSAMEDYESFRAAYRDILDGAARLLRLGGYFAIVVSEVRDKAGNYRGLVPDTIEALADAGVAYYNDVVLLNPVGSLAVRAGRQFSSFRKVGRRHQNLIVGVKGAAQRGSTVERAYEPDPQLVMFGGVA